MALSLPPIGLERSGSDRRLAFDGPGDETTAVRWPDRQLTDESAHEETPW